ncbi:MAG: TRCF domain-containing protein, partial [Christensenellales bacterium]
RDFTQFGSGLKIALRDLEIRGAGNILGAEQSGHMSQIGYDLYCKLIKEEISGKRAVKGLDTAVELNLNAFIPKEYIEDEALKLDMYRRIVMSKSLEEAKRVREELSDRFGKPPKEIENLIGISLMRSFAEKAGISSVIRKGKTVELKFGEHVGIDFGGLERLLKGYKDIASLKKSVPPVIVVKPLKGRLYMDIMQICEQIKRCIYMGNQV